MEEQDVKIKKGAGDECSVALALLLFGNSETKLPGGYVSQELSSDSPIAQVVSFPSEFILLGRATGMCTCMLSLYDAFIKDIVYA